MPKNFLEIENVTFAASEKNKVNNVSFDLNNEGEIVCLLGPSGIGKTTILRTIAGLEKIRSGKIMLKGKMDSGVWSCGLVTGLINDVPTVKELIDRIISQAKYLINQRLAEL